MKKFIIYVFVMLFLIVGGAYLLNNFISFSEGDRSGVLIKFSNKGILHKTWEGELTQGLANEHTFKFSVEDSQKEIIATLREYNGQEVQLEYKERFFTFPWMGDTKHFITKASQKNIGSRSSNGEYNRKENNSNINRNNTNNRNYNGNNQGLHGKSEDRNERYKRYEREDSIRKEQRRNDYYQELDRQSKPRSQAEKNPTTDPKYTEEVLNSKKTKTIKEAVLSE